MTISSTTNRVAYSGNGVTTAFSFPYKFLANADLVVIETVIATGVQTTKTLTTHYTVTGAGDPSGGTVTALVAPASTVTWTIYRDPAATQTVDLVENDPLPVETALEAPLDKLTMIAQRLRDLINRAFRLSDGDTSGAATTLSTPGNAGKFVRLNAGGTALEFATGEESTAVYTPTGGVQRTFVSKFNTIRHLSDYNTLAIAIAQSYGRTLILDVQGNVNVPGGLSIDSPIKIIQEPGCVLRPTMAAGDSIWCRINSSDVEWLRPVIDGSQLPAISSVNKYMLLAQKNGGGTLSRINIYKPKIYSCEASDGNVGLTNLLVTHAIYLGGLEDIEVDIELLEDISGCGVFGVDLSRTNIRNGKIDDTGWSSMQFDSGCAFLDIAYTKMLGTSKTAGRFWGGSINLMSLQGLTKNRKVRLFRLQAEGPHNYGSVFRCLSVDDLDVIECEARDCTRGTNSDAPAGGMSYFTAHTRGVSSSDKQEPGTNNNFHRNKGYASGTGHRFIECQNQYHTNNPWIGLTITENECRSPHETNHYFSNAIVVHGQDGGYRSVRVVGNPYLQVKTAAGGSFDGAIMFGANSANGQVNQVSEGGNGILNIRTSGWGTGDRGVNIADRTGPFVRVAPDFIDGFYYGTFVSTNVTDARNINHQVIQNLAAGGSETIVNTQPSRVDNTTVADTTGNRPASGVRINYEQRFNTTTGQYEFFHPTNDWTSLVSVADGLYAATATQLADKTHNINTKNKYANKQVRNSTDGKRYFANGSTDVDIWILADASASITPV